MPTVIDLVIIFLTISLPLAFWFRESIPFIGGKPRSALTSNGVAASAKSKVEEGDPRDFIGKMERGVSIWAQHDSLQSS